MSDRTHDNVPVHVRTRTDSETGDAFIVAVLELDGVEMDLASWPAEAFEKVYADLQAGLTDAG